MVSFAAPAVNHLDFTAPLLELLTAEALPDFAESEALADFIESEALIPESTK